ncbi:MAG: hypothetical protein ACFCVG_07640 [Kineosporiaceae bacterium]
MLTRAILQLNRPTGPPDRSARGRLGLHLLRSVLALDHIERVSESVRVTDATHMQRDIVVDVDLSRSKHLIQPLRPEPWRRSTGVDDLWVAIGRHPRGTMGSVAPRDGTGAVVPRMTSRESNRLIASGLLVILQGLQHEAGRPDGDATDQWLVEAAVLAIVEDGRRHWPRTPPRLDQALARAEAQDRRRDALRSRAAAIRLTDVDPVFFDLLYTFAVDQAVVVRLDATHAQHRVTYRAPELEARNRGLLGPGIPSLPLMRPRELTVEYTTAVPAHVELLHLDIEVPADIEVRSMLVSTDADEDAVSGLADDIEQLAELAADEKAAARVGVFQSRSITARLDELILRRSEDLAEYRDYRQRLDARLPWLRRLLVGKMRERSRKRLADLLRAVEQTAERSLPIPDASSPESPPSLPAHDLRRVSRMVRRLDLGRDLHVDQDARENGATVLWRRHGSGVGVAHEQPVEARALVTLVDSRPSAALESFGLLFVNALLVVALLSAFPALQVTQQVYDGQFTDTWWDHITFVAWHFPEILRQALAMPGTTIAQQAEVVVTLLLLVLGLIIRTDRAPARSVLAQLRRIPFWLGWLSIAVNALIAIVIVAWPAGTDSEAARIIPTPAVWLLVTPLLVLTVVSGFHALNGVRQWLRFAPPYVSAPHWLCRRGVGRGRFRRGLRPSVVFHAGSPEPDAGRPSSLDVPRALRVVTQTIREADHPVLDFEVVHSVRRQASWPKQDSSGTIAADGELHGTLPPSELFLSDIDALTHRIATRMVANSPPVEGRSAPRIRVEKIPPSARQAAWRGSARLDSEFTDAFRDKVDILLTLAPGEWGCDDQDAVRLSEAVGHVLESAAENGLPVTFVRAPSAGFRNNRTEAGTGDPFHARGRNVRVTVGLPRRSADRRRTLLTDIAARAEERGHGLHVADRGYGPLNGRWVNVLPVPEHEPAPLWSPTHPPFAARLRLVTAVGPSRTGAFASVVKAMREARTLPYAVTCLTQQELGVVHALVAASRGSSWAGRPTRDRPEHGPLREILSRLGRRHLRDEPLLDDYVLMAGAVSRAAATETSAGHAVWARWELRDMSGIDVTADERTVVDHLLRLIAEDAAVDPSRVQIEYHRSRQRSPSSRLERVKVAIVLRRGGRHDDEVPAVLDALSERVRIRLGNWRPSSGTGRLVHPYVGAREARLGTWIDDIR